jgi:hypothetical protein
MIKKKLHILILGLGIAGLVALPASAALAANVLAPACRGHATADACESNDAQPTSGNAIYGPNGLLTRAASFIAVLVGITSIIMIIVGGFKYVTSSGDPGNIKSAKDTIMFAIVGILVAVTAQSIVVFVLREL